MVGAHEKADIIRFIESLPDDESARIAIFIAGMQAQKNIGIQAVNHRMEQPRKPPEAHPEQAASNF